MENRSFDWNSVRLQLPGVEKQLPREECVLEADDEEEQPLLRSRRPNSCALQNSKDQIVKKMWKCVEHEIRQADMQRVVHNYPNPWFMRQVFCCLLLPKGMHTDGRREHTERVTGPTSSHSSEE